MFATRSVRIYVLPICGRSVGKGVVGGYVAPAGVGTGVVSVVTGALVGFSEGAGVASEAKAIHEGVSTQSKTKCHANALHQAYLVVPS